MVVAWHGGGGLVWTVWLVQTWLGLDSLVWDSLFPIHLVLGLGLLVSVLSTAAMSFMHVYITLIYTCSFLITSLYSVVGWYCGCLLYVCACHALCLYMTYAPDRDRQAWCVCLCRGVDIGVVDPMAGWMVRQQHVPSCNRQT